MDKKQGFFKKRKSSMLYTPMQLTDELKKLGESYDKKTAGLYYLVILMAAVAFGFFLELRPEIILLIAAAYLVFVPQLLYNRKKHAYEKRRFNDLNSYMHQMIQSFTRTRHVPTSLRETLNTFTSGKMQGLLSEAIELIDNETDDPRAAEELAFYKIAEQYGCEKLKTLHDFLLKAERRGGECAAEFGLLEKSRELWKNAVEDYHQKLVMERNYGSLMYLMVMLINIFLMRYVETMELCITNADITQIVNAVMLVGFMLFFVCLDRRLNSSLLLDAHVMEQEEVDSLFSYMQGFDSKKERRKYIVIGILSVIGAVALMVIFPSFSNFFVGIGIIALGFNVHRIVLALTIRTLKKEILKEFPKWLFDMLLLLQRESVEGSIFQSVDRAAPVLKGELQRVSNALQLSPQNADIYMSFMADFNVQNIEETMRTLYSLSVGTGGEKMEIMGVIIESNITLLAKAERDSIEEKASYSGMVENLPILVGTFSMMGYTVVLLTVVLEQITSML